MEQRLLDTHAHVDANGEPYAHEHIWKHANADTEPWQRHAHLYKFPHRQSDAHAKRYGSAYAHGHSYRHAYHDGDGDQRYDVLPEPFPDSELDGFSYADAIERANRHTHANGGTYAHSHPHAAGYHEHGDGGAYSHGHPGITHTHPYTDVDHRHASNGDTEPERNVLAEADAYTDGYLDGHNDGLASGKHRAVRH